MSCISFDSYIKPQLINFFVHVCIVVYLLIPTSNHNARFDITAQIIVVYLLIPTSNHNSIIQAVTFRCVVYLLIPTSNHNL